MEKTYYDALNLKDSGLDEFVNLISVGTGLKPVLIKLLICFLFYNPTFALFTFCSSNVLAK